MVGLLVKMAFDIEPEHCHLALKLHLVFNIPDICHKHHKRCLWRKNLSCGENFPYDKLSCGEVPPHDKYSVGDMSLHGK